MVRSAGGSGRIVVGQRSGRITSNRRHDDCRTDFSAGPCAGTTSSLRRCHGRLFISSGRAKRVLRLSSESAARTMFSTPGFVTNRTRVDLGEAEPARLLESGQFDAARRAAQNQLRFRTEPETRKKLLQVASKAYESLPAYKFPSYQLVPLGRAEIITASPPDSPPTHQSLADELLFLGLYDEAAPELAAARSQGQQANEKAAQPAANNSATDQTYTEAVYFLRGGMPYPAVRFAEQVWRTIPADYLVELAPRQLTEMLYPAAYQASAVKYSQARQLDPRFVLSIARQETRFQAEAKSVAAARGLMQFIAATAEQTAKQLGRHDFDQDDLYNADTALQFGTQYLSTLFQQFPN